MEKVSLWKILYRICCVVLLVSFFLPAMKVDLGEFGGYSFSFADIAFGIEGEMSRVLLLILPALMIAISFVNTKWKYISYGINILSLIGFIILLPYIDDFTMGLNPLKPQVGYIVYFIGMVIADYFNEKLKKAEERIDEEKKMAEEAASYSDLTCPQCGAPLKINAKFCEKCGVRLEDIIAKKVFCPNCGRECGAADKFCDNCGMKLS